MCRGRSTRLEAAISPLGEACNVVSVPFIDTNVHRLVVIRVAGMFVAVPSWLPGRPQDTPLLRIASIHFKITEFKTRNFRLLRHSPRRPTSLATLSSHLRL